VEIFPILQHSRKDSHEEEYHSWFLGWAGERRWKKQSTNPHLLGPSVVFARENPLWTPIRRHGIERDVVSCVNEIADSLSFRAAGWSLFGEGMWNEKPAAHRSNVDDECCNLRLFPHDFQQPPHHQHNKDQTKDSFREEPPQISAPSSRPLVPHGFILQK